MSVVQALAMGYITGFLWMSEGFTLLSAGAGVIAGVSLGALLEALRTRVTLEDETLELRTLWGTRRVARRDIREVVVARGGKAGIRLTDASWVPLPSAGAVLGQVVQDWWQH